MAIELVRNGRGRSLARFIQRPGAGKDHPERNKLGLQITTNEYIRSENLSKPVLHYLVRSEIRSAFLEGIEKPSGPSGRRGFS